MAPICFKIVLLAAVAHLSHGLALGGELPSAERLTYSFVKIPSENGINTYEAIDVTDNTGNANDYLDEVFREVVQYMDKTGHDKYPLPDELLQFKKKIGPITFSGKFGLRNGFIKGLDTIHRAGNCSITTKDMDMFIDANAGLYDAKLSYDTVLEFEGQSLTGSVAGTVDETSAESKLVVKDLQNVTLTYFHITHIGHIATDISGLGPFNFLAELLSDFTIKCVKGAMPMVLDGPMKSQMQTVINKIPISNFFPH